MEISWIDTNWEYEEAILLSEKAKQDNIILIPKHYKDVFVDNNSEYQIWYGSRVSAKSYIKALQFLFKAFNQVYFRGLFARQTQKDARDSQYQLFEDLIMRIYPFLQDEFYLETSKMRITCKQNGNFMKGASFEEPPRSLAEYTDFWVDEPITSRGSIERKDLLDISGTLRNSYGIKSQKHLTFNPISKNTFIYKDFFGIEKPIFDSNILLCNYQHNVFCPPEKIKELERYKEIDYSRYLVDSLGEWGEPKSDSPFLHALQDFNFGETRYNPTVPIWLSFDFNKNCSCIVSQHYVQMDILHLPLWQGFKSGDKGGIYYLREFQARAVGSDAFNDMIKSIIEAYPNHYYYISGDASGSAEGAARGSLFGLIQESLFKLDIPENRFEFVGIHGKNLLHSISYVRCNTLIKHFGVNFVIDKSCKQLISDCYSVSVNEAGGLDKTTEKSDKEGLVGHLLDCLRYDLANFEGLTYKYISQAGTELK